MFEVYCAIGNGIPIVPVLIEASGYNASASEKFLTHLEKNLDQESLASIQKYGLDVVDMAYKLSCVVPTLVPIPFNFKESKKKRLVQLQAIKDAVHLAKFTPITIKKEEWQYHRSTSSAVHSIPIAVASIVSANDGYHGEEIQTAKMVDPSDLTVISAVHELESAIMGDSPSGVAAACDYLFEKCGGDTFKESDNEIRADITRAGAIQVVVSGLEQFMGSPDIPANVGLIKLFRNLARNDENKVIMMEDVNTVFANMVGHMKNASIQQWGCLVILSLAVNDANRGAMAKMGAGDIVIQGMRTHKNDLSVQCNGYGALAALAGNVANQAKLIKIGAGEVIMRAIDQHKDNIPIQTQGCSALFHLSTHPETKPLLITMGAGDVVIETMIEHPFDTELQKYGCAFIYSTSLVKSNVPKLIDLRAREIVTSTMKHHSHVAAIHDFGEKALDNLSKT